MKRALCIISLSLAFGACKTNHVLVKFKNNSSEDFKTLKVRILGAEYYFENLRSGETTRFISVKETYPYCYAKAVTSKDTVIAQPIDFVGEKLWHHGKLTMKLSIYNSPSGKRLLDVNSR